MNLPTDRIAESFRAGFYRLFPIFVYRKASKAINREETVSEYKKSLETEKYSEDIDSLLSTVEDAHRSELDRSNRLDSKAGNYLGNIGVVLSILSLVPVLTVALGLNGQRITSGGLLGLSVSIIFIYSILALLLSAYFSAMALKMREYRVYFTASEMKEWVKKEDINRQKAIKELLICKKNNEVYNLEKNNAISVAGTFSRNALIGLGIGIGLTILSIIPLDSVLSLLPGFLYA